MSKSLVETAGERVRVTTLEGVFLSAGVADEIAVRVSLTDGKSLKGNPAWICMGQPTNWDLLRLYGPLPPLWVLENNRGCINCDGEGAHDPADPCAG